jgi:NTP pyrophosphatase (non-canonical NTP hydrolase)
VSSVLHAAADGVREERRAMTLAEFQGRIDSIYGQRDRARGTSRTFLWFSEEVGELAEGIRLGSRESMQEEFADVAAWLMSLANIEGIDLEKAVTAKYGLGCPRCHGTTCCCVDPTRRSG